MRTKLKKPFPETFKADLFRIVGPTIIARYNKDVCATCGEKMPVINSMEEFPRIEYEMFAHDWNDEDGDPHTSEGIDIIADKLYCKNEHESILEIMVPLDFLNDQLETPIHIFGRPAHDKNAID